MFFQQKIVPETLDIQLAKAFNDTEISVQINREPKINKVSEYDRGTRQIEKDVMLEFSSGQRIQCDLAYLSDVNSQWLTEAFFRFNFKVDVDMIHQNIDLIKKILYEVESVNLVEYEFDD